VDVPRAEMSTRAKAIIPSSALVKVSVFTARVYSGHADLHFL
jgi:hypothetical protein